jgi:hypothetical protein
MNADRVVVLSRRAPGRPVVSLAAAVLVIAVISPSAVIAQVPKQAAQSSAIAGNWSGQFLGSAFTFEFRQVGAKWSGRYHSTKSGKWNTLNNVTVTGGNIRFEFTSTPKIVVSLRGSGANMLVGAAQASSTGNVGPTQIPMTLTRSAGAK